MYQVKALSTVSSTSKAAKMAKNLPACGVSSPHLLKLSRARVSRHAPAYNSLGSLRHSSYLTSLQELYYSVSESTDISRADDSSNSIANSSNYTTQASNRLLRLEVCQPSQSRGKSAPVQGSKQDTSALPLQASAWGCQWACIGGHHSVEPTASAIPSFACWHQHHLEFIRLSS